MQFFPEDNLEPEADGILALFCAALEGIGFLANCCKSFWLSPSDFLAWLVLGLGAIS